MLITCHSPHERCGVGEYGRQLDRAFGASAMAKNLNDTSGIRDASGPGRALLVHFEPGIVPEEFTDTLRHVRDRGAIVIFCCHLFERAKVVPYVSLVDAFAVHRSVGDSHVDGVPIVEIPLGCPVYVPGDRDAIRTRLGWSGKTVLVTLGFLSRWKRFPETVRAMMPRLDGDLHVHVQAPMPFDVNGSSAAEEHARLSELVGARVSYSNAFLPEQEMLDMVHASDLGFLFHGQHTYSVSAASKQFISARRPLAITDSSHDWDLRDGVHRIGGFSTDHFAQEVVRIARSEVLPGLQEGAAREYGRINMNVVAGRYVELARSLGCTL